MIADDLARWVVNLRPSESDLGLADRALLDSVGCAVAAREHPVMGRSRSLADPERWAVATHVLDLDDLHLPSTAHISTVCVPATVAAGGGPRDYLAGAGVMARVGTALGWRHYSAGWHATTTAGAIGAAACAASALGLSEPQIATAVALAVPASGGLQRAFGTDAKSLQVGFAVSAGIRAARLAADAAQVDISVVDAWLPLVAASATAVGDLESGGPAVPGGLAVKLFPCCYAVQRPIAAVQQIREGIDPQEISRISVRTPAASVQPLIHSRPRTGLESKFSLEYAVVAALLDDAVGMSSFTDAAVQRDAARALVELVDVERVNGGDGLLAGEVVIGIQVRSGKTYRTRLAVPPGAPSRPPSAHQLAQKVEECLAGTGIAGREITWRTAARILTSALGSGSEQG